MEYLKLALRFPESFKSILAVTFTNKATQEMKDRILKELKRLRFEIQPKEKMDAEIMKALGIGEEEFKLRANQSLSAILHDYGRFSVSTIDSFFQKVVRAFAREMDLNAKFEVEMDQDGVLDRVVDRVVAKVMDDEFLHKWLVDYAVDQIQQGHSWDIRKNIKNLGKQLFQEDFKKYGSEIKAFLKDKDNILNLQGFVRERRKEILSLAIQIKEEANVIRVMNGLEWADYSRGFPAKFDKLGSKEKPISDFTENQKQFASSPEGWAIKKSPNKQAIEKSYYDGLGILLEQIEPLEFQWNTVDAIGRNIFVFGIFRNLLEELTLLKDEEDILLISDANEFLKEITYQNDAPFIYEKVGNKFKNYLIDEFQDTSGFQWASFKPLLENSLSQGQTNLLVGDVKQSIYRWRGGEMKLLLEEVESQIGSQKVRNENLDTNFRSLPNIIAFNNALFDRLPQFFQETVSEAYQAEDAGILTKAYKDVYQKVSARKSNLERKGKVRLKFLDVKENEDEGNFDAQALLRLPSIVMELLDKGYELKDIAFLVRKKDQGEAIADTLMAFESEHPELGYRFDVLSDESMYLYKSSSVKALLAGLRYLHDPEDKVQFKTMWYHRSVLRDEPVNHHLFSLEQVPDYLKEKVKFFQKKEYDLLQLPLLEAVEEMIVILDLHLTGMEKAYISGFKEAVYDFSANNRVDLAGFLEWWEDNQNKRTVKIPEGHNAMRVMTIHKSKGLQFKVVLLPFLKWNIFDTTKGNVVWSPFLDRDRQLSAIVPLTLQKQLAQSDFKETYAEEAILAYLDSLNMVYVAMTRAEEVIWGLIPFRSEIKKDASFNNLELQLQRLFCEPSPTIHGTLDLHSYFDPETKVFDFGEWPIDQNVPTPSAPVPDLRWTYRNWSDLLQVKHYAVDFSEEGLLNRKKRKYGQLIHEILEKSASLQEVAETLREFCFEGRISDEERIKVEAQLKSLFSNPLFLSWFSVKGDLLAEQGILMPGGKQKRPDRIILDGENAVVVDFKTGAELDQHQHQVLEYMELVGKLSNKPVKGYLCYLETEKIVEVR